MSTRAAGSNPLPQLSGGSIGTTIPAGPPTIEPLDADLVTIAGMTPAPEQIYRFDNTGSLEMASCTDLATSLLASATAEAMRDVVLPSKTGNSLKSIRINAGETDWEVYTPVEGGDALVADTLDQFADVTQTAGKTLDITDDTVLAGGNHSGTNTGDQTPVSLGLEIGVDVQAWSTALDAVSVSLTAAGLALINDLDAAAQRTTLGLSSLDVVPAPVASVNFAQQQATQFRIENRTSDPGSPAVGQIWLRTDL